jgi:hypothetical protein
MTHDLGGTHKPAPTVADCAQVALAAKAAAEAYALAGEAGMARIYADHCAAAFHMARIIAGVPHYDHSTPPTAPEHQA